MPKGIKGFQKGHPCYTKTFIKKGQHISPKTEFKKGIIPFSKLHPEIMPRGKNHWRWKGGQYKTKKGYIFILKPKHPFCDYRGYIMEHRLVIEKQIGRYLKLKERVHHINEIKSDNRIENLMLFVSTGYHSVFHRWGYCYTKHIIFNGYQLKANTTPRV